MRNHSFSTKCRHLRGEKYKSLLKSNPASYLKAGLLKNVGSLIFIEVDDSLNVMEFLTK